MLQRQQQLIDLLILSHRPFFAQLQQLSLRLASPGPVGEGKLRRSRVSVRGELNIKLMNDRSISAYRPHDRSCRFKLRRQSLTEHAVSACLVDQFRDIA